MRMRGLAVLVALAAAVVPMHGQEDGDRTVKAIAPMRMEVGKGGAHGELPVYVSADWTRPQPAITRALIVFHGKQRNADTYNASGEKAIRSAQAGGDTLLVTPQFLAAQDVAAFHLPADVLRWGPEQWMGGDDALGSALSSFDAIDAILLRLADRTLFPNLRQVVLAGHSGGGQVLARYAVVGKAAESLIAKGIAVRYVVANPSSYLYFSPDRPLDNGGFGVPRKSCYGRYNEWKYGVQSPPPYVGNASFGALETRFAGRDVIYLLGTKDTDPNQSALDKSCAAEDQGPYRYVRGHSYFRYLQGRHPGLTQRVWDVDGVGHDGDRMFNSPCGLFALFGVGACPSASGR